MKSPELSRPPAMRAARWFEALSLLFIIVGLACRFVGLNWDEGTLLHPDERFVLDLIGKIGWPVSLGQWFDSTRSPFDPAGLKNVHFVYGQWPLLLGKVAALALGKTELVSALPQARALSALFDSFTVALTFVLARRVLPREWALFAAASVALSALHVQQSHFLTVDNFAAFWMLAAFWGLARWQQSGRARDSLLSGLCLGLALSCKISAIFIAVPLLILLAFGARQHPARQLWASVVGGILVALVTFRVFQPMAFIGEFGFFDVRLDPRFWNDLAYQAAITRGEIDVPFDVQWIGRAPWLFSLGNLGFWGYGWGLLISGAAGAVLALAGWRKRGPSRRDALTRDNKTPILLASALFCLILLGVQGATFSKFTRYFLPMTPFMSILSASAWQWAVARRHWLKIGPPLVLGFTALWCLAVTSIYTRPHTRLEASRWIVKNIAPGTVVANETPWDEGLPLAWAKTGDGGLKGLTLNSFDPDTPAKREKMLEILDESAWIFQSSGRSWQNIPRWPAKWPMTSRFYYALWNGDLGFERAREFTSYPQLGPLQFPDDNAEEALSVYDHPHVILWKKSPNYSPAKARQILEAAPLPMTRDWQPRTASN